jgi:hypothetical protein
LYVGLKAYDNERGILPIIADLATTDESAWCLSIGEAKARTDWANAARSQAISCTDNRNGRAIEVGFHIAKASPRIHADVPTNPVIDGRRRRRWSLGCYISRESRPASGEDESGPGNDGNGSVAHWESPEATILPSQNGTRLCPKGVLRRFSASVAL